MESFTLLSNRTLPSEHHLSHFSCCPTMDLAVLTLSSNDSIGQSSRPTDHPTIGHDTIACYRLSGSMPQVWSVSVNKFLTENCPCVDISGAHLDLREPSMVFDGITTLHWSPDGQCLVVALSSSKSPSLGPFMMILSVHSGQLLAFPTMINPSGTDENDDRTRGEGPARGKSLDFFAWLSLDKAVLPPKQQTSSSNKRSPPKDSIGQSLCDRLPKNLSIPSMSNVENIRNNTVPPYYFSNRSSQAMPNLNDHFPMVRFPPSLISDRNDSSNSRPNVSSLLVVKTQKSRISFFLNGAVYAGSTLLPPEATLTGVGLIPQSISDPEKIPEEIRGGICLKLVWIDSKNSVFCHGTLDLSPSLVPTSSTVKDLKLNFKFRSNPKLAILGLRSDELNEQLQLSHSIQSLLKDCFFGYSSVVKEWYAARMCGRKWYESFEEISKAHNVITPPRFQMLQLLFAGQASEGLRDFLGTKTADRIFTKWESTVTGSLTRIRLALVDLLIPDFERLIILVTELMIHSYPHHKPIKIIEQSDFEKLLWVESILKNLLKAAHSLDKEILEESERFQHFCKWLRLEFDYVNALENAPNPPGRPPIKYDLMTVSKFIRRGESNPLDPLIFPQLPGPQEDWESLQDDIQPLVRAHYEELYDIDGAQKRSENKKRLYKLLSADLYNRADEEKTVPEAVVIEPRPGPQLTPNFVTPDTSHFTIRRDIEVQTPTLLSEHIKRQKDEASLTPLGFSVTKLKNNRSIMLGSLDPEDSMSLNDDKEVGDHQEKEDSKKSSLPPSEEKRRRRGRAVRSLGIYEILERASSTISEIFGSMFLRIGDSRPIVSEIDQSSEDLKNSGIVPTNINNGNEIFCSRFIGKYYFSGFLSEDSKSLIIHRSSIKTIEDEGKLGKDEDYLRMLNRFKFRRTNSDDEIDDDDEGNKNGDDDEGEEEEEEDVKVIDLDFFDEFEIVLLVQIGIGFNTKYLVLTIKFRDHFFEDRFENKEFESLKVYRVHQLGSEFIPEKLSLNGYKGRRIGCIISGNGRMINVFDMEVSEDDYSNFQYGNDDDDDYDDGDIEIQ